jgi:hypothetical protein
MRTIRAAVSAGPFPTCLAPEGQVSYHNHRLGQTGTGTARLAVWCLEDLERSGRGEQLLIVPVAPHYLYRNAPERQLERILERFAADSGLTPPEGASGYEKLIELTEGLLDKMEAFYARFFAMERSGRRPGSLRDRIERVCGAALQVPEHFMSIRPEKDLLSRVFTVRQRGWDYLFRADQPPEGKLPVVDRVLMDRIADEAYLHLRHNELADVLEYLHPEYIAADASLNRLIEYALNLCDVTNRLAGGDIGHRYSPPGKTVHVRIGEPIEVRDLLPLIPGRRRDKAEGLMKVVVSRLEALSAER